MINKISIETIKKQIDKLLDATHPLAESHPKNDSNNYFLRVIEGIFRRNYYTMLAVRYISDQPNLADSIMVLMRKMSEDLITIEYMLIKNKEDMAKRFYQFLDIQIYEEIMQRKRLNYDIPPQKDIEDLVKRVEKLKPIFWHEKSNSFYRSWSGKSAEQMLFEIADAKSLTKHDIHVILLGYTHGSWKNHPNPVDIISHMTNNLRHSFATEALMEGTILSLFNFIRLTTRYVDEIRYTYGVNVHEDINKVVLEMFNYLDYGKYS